MARKLRKGNSKSKSEDFDGSEVKKIVFHSILSYLSKKKGPLSKLEIRDLIIDALELTPGLRVEWAEIKKFGKNKLLVNHYDKVMLLDMGEILETIQKTWDGYLESRDPNFRH
ncbi:hypothetical protein CH373_10320 [Leptospira perolatii]|uniref:Uncharacterized protein n=1 Tax=Leptospira perolatii TaxID=2023191 RepID=A0A2M9ZMY8_9LEPT|nr:hypothetical protein [Leptospira perolatii]PJZ70160.1 hypothetical protein CH360_08065 [Leptospira perolatii]PJZ73349.1 hypothetical protein CH373_10320 [Leptospira perolatii]